MYQLQINLNFIVLSIGTMFTDNGDIVLSKLIERPCSLWRSNIKDKDVRVAYNRNPTNDRIVFRHWHTQRIWNIFMDYVGFIKELISLNIRET